MIKNYEFCNLDIKSYDKAELFFYGEIVSQTWDKWNCEDTAPSDIAELLKEIGDRDIDIHINSPGGSVFGGNAIYNLLKLAKGIKTVYIDGLAASIASVIAMAGDTIVMPRNSYMMLHKPLISTCGNADELGKQIKILDKIESGIIETYMTRANPEVTIDDMAEYLRKETWLSADEASEIFSNIDIVDDINAVATLSEKDFSYSKNMPENAKKLLKSNKPSEIDMSEFENFEKLLTLKYY